MGGASGQQSQSQGSSSGTSNFSSFPQNLQYPQYSNLATPVANAIGGALTGSGNAGFQQGNGQLYQPSAVYNPSLGYNVLSGDTANNPLVAPLTGGQQGALSTVNEFAPSNQINSPTSPLTQAYRTAAGIPGAIANQGATPFYYGAGNVFNAATGNGQPSTFQPGQGASQLAGGAAQQILPQAQPALGAATQQATGWDFGTQLANASGNAAYGGNFGTGTAGAGAGSALGGNFGTGTAAGGANFAQGAQFGAPQANTAAGFAGAGQQLSPVQQALANEMNPAFAYNTAVNPFTQGVVGAAVNPLIQSFNAQTVPGLQGTFTAAGQRVNAGAGGGVGGSSAFDIAGANALTGLGANIGSTAASILNPTYQTGLGIQANAPVQAAGVQGQILQGLESSAAQQQASEQAKAGALNQAATTQATTQGAQTSAINQAAQTQASTQAQQISSLSQAAQTQLQTQTGKTTAELQAASLAGTLTAQESAALTAASQASTANAAAQAGAGTAAVNAGVAASNAQVQQLATAATTNQQIATQQLNDTINALNANALPQLTQQYGINQGLSLYNTQVNQLLTAMGLGGQVSQPAIGNIASGGGSSFGQNTSSGGGKGFTLF